MTDTSKEVVLETLDQDRDYWRRRVFDATTEESRLRMEAYADAFTEAIDILRAAWKLP